MIQEFVRAPLSTYDCTVSETQPRILGVMTSAYIARANPYQVENVRAPCAARRRPFCMPMTDFVPQDLLTIAQTAVQVAEYNRPPSLILAFLPVNAPDIRRRIKHWGDVDKGVPTQCLVRIVTSPLLLRRIHTMPLSARGSGSEPKTST